MEVAVVFLMMVAFLALIWGVFYLILTIFQSREARQLGRVVRRGRFGLKSAIGAMAFVAVTLGLTTALGGDMWDLGTLCLLTVVAPLALFLVTFFGLMFTELFDRESTRQLVARRAREDEIEKMFRERWEDAVVDAELVEPATESPSTDGADRSVTAADDAAADTADHGA
jgi:hypothetical protein